MLVGPAGLHRAAGVVVAEDHGGCLVVQGAHDDFAGVNRGLAERAPKKFFHGQHAVLVVQKQHGKDLVVFVGQLQLQVLLDRARRVKSFAFFEALAECPARQLEHGQQLGLFGRPQAFDPLQRGHGGVEQARNAVWLQQFFGQLEHVFARHARAQQDGQELHIAQGLRATGEQFFARTRVKRQVLDAHVVPLPGAAFGPFYPL